MSVGISSGLPLIRDGKLVALAVSTQKRASALPDVPTSIEAGFPDSDYTFWNGLFVPAKTPPEIIDRLYQQTQGALQLPQVQQKFAPQSIEPMPLAPHEFDALVRKEIVSNIALVKAAGLKFN
jgi:tripartite-type tricarboxylate transporter receptor subunit TctC